jgi:hypothetical protein
MIDDHVPCVESFFFMAFGVRGRYRMFLRFGKGKNR